MYSCPTAVRVLQLVIIISMCIHPQQKMFPNNFFCFSNICSKLQCSAVQFKPNMKRKHISAL